MYNIQASITQIKENSNQNNPQTHMYHTIKIHDKWNRTSRSNEIKLCKQKQDNYSKDNYQNKPTTTQKDKQNTQTTTSSQHITEKQNKKENRPPSLRKGEAALN